MNFLQQHLAAATPAFQANAFFLAGCVTALCAIALFASIAHPSGMARRVLRAVALPFAVGTAFSACNIWLTGFPATAFSDAAAASMGMSPSALDGAFASFVSSFPAQQGIGLFGAGWPDAAMGLGIMLICGFVYAMLTEFVRTDSHILPAVRMGATALSCIVVATIAGVGLTASALRTSPAYMLAKRFDQAAVFAGPLMARLDGREIAELAARR